MWWTQAVELALEKEGHQLQDTDFFFLVNNDTVLQSDTIERLICASRAQGGAVVAASVREVSGRAIAAGANMEWGLSLSQAVFAEHDTQKSLLLPVDVVFGRATIVPVACYRYIGNFDGAAFPQYYGDSDYFLRASKAGIPVFIDASTRVFAREDEYNTGIHHVGNRKVGALGALRMLVSRRSNLNLPNGWRFVWRHAPRGKKVFALFVLTLQHTKSAIGIWLESCKTCGAIRLFCIIFRRRVYRTMLLPFRYATLTGLRRSGLDPVAMLGAGQIRKSDINHTYVVRRTALADPANSRGLRRFVLQRLNPVAYLRVRRFVRAWVRRQTKGLPQAPSSCQ